METFAKYLISMQVDNGVLNAALDAVIAVNLSTNRHAEPVTDEQVNESSTKGYVDFRNFFFLVNHSCLVSNCRY